MQVIFADRFVKKKWTKVFDHFTRQVNSFLPRIEEIFSQHGYYWFIEQCEYASDVLFKDRETLEMVFPYFIKYASLCQMGKNISNLYRYAEVTRKCNERYLDSLAALNKINNLDKAVESLCHPQKTRLSKNSIKERQYSALNPLKDFSCKALNAVMNGAYMMKGFITKQLTDALISLNAFKQEQCSNIKKLKAKVGRFIAQLKAHKIVTKLPKTHRYRVTKTGIEILSRILMFNKIDLKFC